MSAEQIGALCSYHRIAWAGTCVAVASQGQQARRVGDGGSTSRMSDVACECSQAEEVLRRIRSEYVEMPGLRLTVAQAQRIFGLDRATCESVLEALVEAKFLRRARDGAFVRVDGDTPVG